MGHNAAYWAKEFSHLDVLQVFSDVGVQPVSLSSAETYIYSSKNESEKKQGQKNVIKQLIVFVFYSCFENVFKGLNMG